MIILTDQQINLLEKKLPIDIFKILLNEYAEALSYQQNKLNKHRNKIINGLFSDSMLESEEHQEGWNDAIGHIIYILWEKLKNSP